MRNGYSPNLDVRVAVAPRELSLGLVVTGRRQRHRHGPRATGPTRSSPALTPAATVPAPTPDRGADRQPRRPAPADRDRCVHQRPPPRSSRRTAGGRSRRTAATARSGRRRSRPDPQRQDLRARAWACTPPPSSATRSRAGCTPLRQRHRSGRRVDDARLRRVPGLPRRSEGLRQRPSARTRARTRTCRAPRHPGQRARAWSSPTAGTASTVTTPTGRTPASRARRRSAAPTTAPTTAPTPAPTTPAPVPTAPAPVPTTPAPTATPTAAPTTPGTGADGPVSADPQPPARRGRQLVPAVHRRLQRARAWTAPSGTTPSTGRPAASGLTTRGTPSRRRRDQTAVAGGDLTLKARRAAGLPSGTTFTSAHLNTRGQVRHPGRRHLATRRPGCASRPARRCCPSSGCSATGTTAPARAGRSTARSTSWRWPTTSTRQAARTTPSGTRRTSTRTLRARGSTPRTTPTRRPSPSARASTTPGTPGASTAAPSAWTSTSTGQRVFTFLPSTSYMNGMALPPMLFTNSMHVRLSLGVGGGWAGQGYTRAGVPGGRLRRPVRQGLEGLAEPHVRAEPTEHLLRTQEVLRSLRSVQVRRQGSTSLSRYRLEVLTSRRSRSHSLNRRTAAVSWRAWSSWPSWPPRQSSLERRAPARSA